MAKRPVEKYDFKAFGQAIKNARKERKESRKKVSDEMLGGPAFAPFCWGCLSFSALTGQSSVAHSS